ncbi:Putative chloroperoxidase [Septoria linicola]|uniref:Chloroperoxidase n=1 Tax=Septoria linicola TaxID=215465 RepID=A0A9Q9AYG0_9PEZI|nr:Putative chloroperoxidase [Septoria linicola]
MKFSVQLLLAASATAFPTMMLEEAVKRDPTIVNKAIEFLEANDFSKRQAGAGSASAIFEPIPKFDAAKQLINVGPGSGHEWTAPRASDNRGPCPGLNAFANHGFLPRNGVATIQQYIDATETVVGMGPVLAGFLSILGAVLDGDLTSWSMGGTPAGALGSLRGNGLSGSHNKYEGDASPTRPDLYQEGDNYKTKVNQFQEMIDYSPGSVTMESLTNFRSHRFDTQIAANPYFFNGPFSGVAVQPAAYTFIFRFMANHSSADPIGLLNHDVVASWFGIEGTSGNYKLVNGKQGQEKIPLNWYRRAQEYPYEVTYFLADLLAAAALHPKFLNIGGNTNGVNSFTGVEIDDLSGGLINAGNLLQGNNLGCFVFQLAAQAKPDVLLGLLNPITDILGSLVTQLSCPQLRTFDDNLLKQFPGYTRKAVYSK